MLNWIKGERSGKRGHTYRSDDGIAPRFIIYPIGSSGRFSLVEVTYSGSGRAEVVIVRGVSIATCKTVAQQLVDEEIREDAEADAKEMDIVFKTNEEDMEAIEAARKEMEEESLPSRGYGYDEIVDKVFGTKTMPSAERRTKEGNENVEFGKTTAMGTKMDQRLGEGERQDDPRSKATLHKMRKAKRRNPISSGHSSESTPRFVREVEQRNSNGRNFENVEVEQFCETELTTGIETLESNTQRNVEPINEGENEMPSATAVSQEPMILSEADARRLAKAMNLPEQEWTTKRLQTKFNKLDELVAEGATEVTEREDKVLLKEISRQLQEWDGEGHAVQIASNGESEATEEAQEAPTRPAKAAKEPKAVPLPNPPRKIVYEQADPPPKTFNQEEMKAILGWREVRKKDGFHFKYQIGDTPRYVALDNCLTNRQFRFPLAKRYAAEHIRKKWSFNGETIVLDKYGCVQQGMHRGVGFVLAEEQRQNNPEKWGKKALTYTTGFQVGIEPANDVVDTIDLGQKRSLGDVLFRNREMGKEYKEKELAKLSRILAGAIRLVWLRITGVSVMGGQAFLHSEALELLKEHEDLVDCVKFIYTEEGGSGADGKKISNYISLAYASGLMYLMAKAKGGKKAAEEFWTLFAGGAFEKGDPILALRESLKRKNAGSGAEREKIIGTVIKAWTLWSEGKKNVKPSDIVVKKDEDPRFGGIDKEKSE